MQVLFTGNELAESLQIVTRALGARAVKPILEGVLIETDENNVTFTCTDGEVTIRTEMLAHVREEGCAVLPAKLLAELTRKLPSGEVLLTVDDQCHALIRYQDSRTALTGMPPADYPDLREPPELYTLTMTQRELKDCIQKTAFAAATDENRKMLTGCLLEIHTDETRFVALDGYRLAMRRMPAQNPPAENGKPVCAIFPARVLIELGRMLPDSDEPVTVVVSGPHAMVRFGRTTLFASLMAGEFINYTQILPADWLTRVRLNRVGFMSAIDRASLVAREGVNNLLKLHMETDEEGGGHFTVAANAERGDVREALDCDMEGVPLDIAFNARYLTEIMRILSDERIWIRFNSNVSPCVICPEEGDDYLFLILPIRLFG